MTNRLLPDFEGLHPDKPMMSINGTLMDPFNQPTEPLRVGDEGYAIVSYKVLAVKHTEKKTKKGETVYRHHITQVRSAYTLEEHIGEKLWNDARSGAARQLEEHRRETTGQDRLAGTEEAAGVPMPGATDDELLDAEQAAAEREAAGTPGEPEPAVDLGAKARKPRSKKTAPDVWGAPSGDAA